MDFEWFSFTQNRKFCANFRAADFGGLVLEAQRELDKKFGHFQ